MDCSEKDPTLFVLAHAFLRPFLCRLVEEDHPAGVSDCIDLLVPLPQLLQLLPLLQLFPLLQLLRRERHPEVLRDYRKILRREFPVAGEEMEDMDNGRYKWDLLDDVGVETPLSIYADFMD